MASALSIGAGAGAGLETLLKRQMDEEKIRQLQQEIQERGRSNRADEDYRNRALQETVASRTATQAERQRATEQDDAVKSASLMGPGQKLDPVTAKRFEGTFLKPLVQRTPTSTQEQRNSPLSNEALAQDAPDITTFAGSPEQRQHADEQKRAQAMMEDPETPDPVRNFLKVRGVVPKGETIPATLFGGGDASNQVKSVKLNGKVVDANYNPKTQKYTYRGQDVTDSVEHYEKPPAPDRVMMWTDQGLMGRPDAAKRVARGEQVNPQATASTRTMQEGAKMLQPHIPELAHTAQALEKAGLFGPVMSRVRHLAEKYGSTLDSENPDESAAAWKALGADIGRDPELGRDRLTGDFAASIGLLATGAGRVHGGARGGGSVQMLDHFKSLLSDAGSLNMFLGRLDALDRYMTGYAKGSGGGDESKPDAGGGGTDAYAEYLKRTKKE